MAKAQNVYTYVSKANALRNAVDHAQSVGLVGLDTEFIQRRTYYPRPALYQMQAGDRCYLIDPLTIEDMTSLKELIEAPKVTKILHGGQFDFELFFNHLKSRPQNFFDTQVAAAFAGLDHLLSYQKLVARVLKVELEKSQTLSNWLQRPLSSEQLDYACDDVLYLPGLYRVLSDKLKDFGRLEWFAEEMARVYPTQVDRGAVYYKQYKSAPKLKGAQLMCFKQLCQWREGEATRQNRPRQWIVPDKLLFQLAKGSKQQQLFSDHPKIKQRYGRALLKAIEQADATSEKHWPKPLIRLVRAGELDLLEKLRGQVNSIAENLDMPVGLLGNKRMLSDLLVCCRDGLALPPEFHGWRAQALGKAFMEQPALVGGSI